ncbi:adenosylcobinamide-GDP ribazoletransferase [Halorubrum sp. BOL3-1]|uniref:adenosylcobinamide-GDP ribazoletransferase n=1 Tax=Halorubrum sp. BOL3-1 TaxID=2497325 RepID=UPI001004FE5C|nr:adenosylcobinamide-GDP ribazoletransferase [Halorubrum sp. BOL3-1]QAU12947.1 adenosylcobinamide-GDP ribazoletransferase [Halorubrum sp. BOL3-1]
MTVAALRGALGFLTRLPLGRDEAAFEAFAGAPWTFPVVGYLVGGTVSLPVAAGAVGALPAPTAALATVCVVYGATGITHLDGVADLGDAAVVHGGPDERRTVLRDSTLGVGGTGALAVVVLGLATGALAVVSAAESAGTVGVGANGGVRTAVGLMVAAEVGARAATAALVCVGDAAHEGLGSSLTERVGPTALLPVVALAAPAALAAWPRFLPGAVALSVAAAVGVAVRGWARSRLGGVSGDVLGATTELARVAALHAGVIAWTLS